MQPDRRPTPARGFTLLELMIVVMMIGILAVLVIPKYRQAELKAEGADVATRVEAINVALKEYEADHDSLPVGTEPVGAPAWLITYMTRDQFQGPSNVTWQYAKTSPTQAATLIITAGAPDDASILLAASAALGSNIATVTGGGSGLLVTLTQ